MTKRNSKELYKIKRRIARREWEQGIFIRQKKKNSGFVTSLLSFGDGRGPWADYLISANQVTPDWFQIPFLRELKL